MSLAESYKRWRHTRGFGVHSPLAFAMVGAVVRPKGGYAFYGYAAVRRTAAMAESAVTKQAEMLLRLAAFVDARSAFIPPHAQAPFLVALRAARSNMMLHRGLDRVLTCDIICSSHDLVPLSTIVEFLATPGRTVALRDAPKGWKESIFNALPEGLMLFGPRNIIVHSRSQMQKIAYSVLI